MVKNNIRLKSNILNLLVRKIYFICDTIRNKNIRFKIALNFEGFEAYEYIKHN